MRIKELEVIGCEFALSEPYEIAYERYETAPNVFVRLVTNEGLVGLGCVSPDPHVTGESIESVYEAIENHARANLINRDATRRLRILEGLGDSLADSPAARAVLDIALHDLIAKAAGLPLWKLLGGYRDRIITSVTVGILPLEETVEAGRGLIERGFKAIKIKGGQDPELDAQRVLALREALGSRIELRFDANQGYDLEGALAFLRLAAPARLELVEQPLPRGSHDEIRELTRSSKLPVMADESLVDLRDAFRIARRGLADMVNVKLVKVGGIAEALRINAVARSAGLETMMGCMDEAGLGIAAGLHVALAMPNVAYADLDGHLDLEDDPTSELVQLREGTLFPAAGPGLGLPDLPESIKAKPALS
jgi:L-alanine-DL-glutamate epimerase-like enolase superfamily enzyme